MAEPARKLTAPTIARSALLDSLFFIASGGAAMRDATGPAVRARALIRKLRERCDWDRRRVRLRHASARHREDIAMNTCTHAIDDTQGLAGPHEMLEVVRIDGRPFVRRCEIRSCPEHLAAIRRARAFDDRFVSIVTR